MGRFVMHVITGKACDCFVETGWYSFTVSVLSTMLTIGMWEVVKQILF